MKYPKVIVLVLIVLCLPCRNVIGSASSGGPSDQYSKFPTSIVARGYGFFSNYQGTLPLLGLSQNILYLPSLTPLGIGLFGNSVSIEMDVGKSTLFLEELPSNSKPIEYTSLILEARVPVVSSWDKISLKSASLIVPSFAWQLMKDRNSNAAEQGYVSTTAGGSIDLEISRTMTFSLECIYQWFINPPAASSVITTNGQKTNFGIGLRLAYSIFGGRPQIITNEPQRSISLKIPKPFGYNVEQDDWLKDIYVRQIQPENTGDISIALKKLPEIPVLFVDFTQDPIDLRILHDTLTAIIDNVKKRTEVNECLVYVSNGQDRRAGVLSSIDDQFWNEAAKITTGNYSDFYNEFDRLLIDLRKMLGNEIKRARYSFQFYISKATFNWIKSPDETFAERLMENGISTSQVTFIVKRNAIDKDRMTLAGCRLVIWP